MCDEMVTDIEDTIFDPESPKLIGDIFRYSQKEHGRCTGKVYVGNGIPVGWVFVKRKKYEDANETYLHETWVSLLDKDEIRREREYHSIGS
jgi:hypothetical protein